MESGNAAALACKHGRLDAWVNNAGIDASGGAHESTPELIERGLRVLQLGVMYGCATAANWPASGQARAQWGRPSCDV